MLENLDSSVQDKTLISRFFSNPELLSSPIISDLYFSALLYTPALRNLLYQNHNVSFFITKNSLKFSNNHCDMITSYIESVPIIQDIVKQFSTTPFPKDKGPSNIRKELGKAIRSKICSKSIKEEYLIAIFFSYICETSNINIDSTKILNNYLHFLKLLDVYGLKNVYDLKPLVDGTYVVRIFSEHKGVEINRGKWVAEVLDHIIDHELEFGGPLGCEDKFKPELIDSLIIKFVEESFEKEKLTSSKNNKKKQKNK